MVWAQAYSTAKVARPATSSGIPGPGSTEKIIPRPNSTEAAEMTSNRRKGRGSRDQTVLRRSLFTGTTVQQGRVMS